MASITLDMATSNNSNSSNVEFFSIKNGESAVVRFMANSIDDFDLHTVHQMNLSTGFRTLSCLRTPNEPFDKCPLCAKGEKINQRFFCKMLVYETAQDGSINAVPKIWNRPISFAHTLKSYMDNYGPLTDIVCKIIRHGEGLTTKYEIIPNLSPAIYTPEVYVKRTDLFDNYEVLGHAITNLDFESMVYVANNNSMPAKNEESSTTQFTPQTQVANNVAPATPTGTPPWNEGVPTNNVPQTPTRYY